MEEKKFIIRLPLKLTCLTADFKNIQNNKKPIKNYIGLSQNNEAIMVQ